MQGASPPDMSESRVTGKPRFKGSQIAACNTGGGGGAQEVPVLSSSSTPGRASYLVLRICVARKRGSGSTFSARGRGV